MSHSTPIDVGDSSSDSGSASSSVVFDHEPFETFCSKVLEFVQTLWGWSSVKDIKIERLSGGGFNRIIGISHVAPNAKTTVDYILRIPRFDAVKMERDVAALRAVRKAVRVPVPHVVCFDQTAGNKLASPYMIQTRLLGTSLLFTYPGLEHDSKQKVAVTLGEFFHNLLSAKGTNAGWFSLCSQQYPKSPFVSTEDATSIGIAPFFETAASPPMQHVCTQTIRDLLVTTFEARKTDGLERLPLDTLRPLFMDRFATMAIQLDDDGWFEDTDFSLCHLDFAPRNILICQDLTIGGILDWDSAVLAPCFLSCTPPYWIWSWKDDEDEDEWTANDTPLTEEEKELKSVFETAAGPEYVRYAYSPAYRLARRLVRFAIDGIRFSGDIHDADAMLEEWNSLHSSFESASKSTNPDSIMRQRGPKRTEQDTSRYRHDSIQAFN